MDRCLPVVVILIFILICCSKEQDPAGTKVGIIGGWINPMYYNDSVIVVTRNNLIDNAYGLEFLSNKKFIERKNAGWCATPPIAYADFTGTWKLNDSTISICVGYWGGTASYKWKILSLDAEKLKILILEEKFDNTAIK